MGVFILFEGAYDDRDAVAVFDSLEKLMHYWNASPNFQKKESRLYWEHELDKLKPDYEEVDFNPESESKQAEH